MLQDIGVLQEWPHRRRQVDTYHITLFRPMLLEKHEVVSIIVYLISIPIPAPAP